MHEDLPDYNRVREGGLGFYEEQCGLIEVSGSEAVMFLNGLITNDAARLENYSWMLAAFPNAQGRLLALVRVMRIDNSFLFVTDAETHEKVLKNLSRFAMAGDFKVDDLTGDFSCFAVRANETPEFILKVPTENSIVVANFGKEWTYIIRAYRAAGFDFFVPKDSREIFIEKLKNSGAVEIGEQAREILRVENGIPKYGVDMDETTVVLETGLAEAVSFTKGCYIGQEIIARIHFRGHVAKQLTGLILDDDAEIQPGDELKTIDGKNAGRVTSTVFSPKLQKNIALAFVRYDYLAEGTELKILGGEIERAARVKNPPFIEN